LAHRSVRHWRNPCLWVCLQRATRFNFFMWYENRRRGNGMTKCMCFFPMTFRPLQFMCGGAGGAGVVFPIKTHSNAPQVWVHKQWFRMIWRGRRWQRFYALLVWVTVCSLCCVQWDVWVIEGCRATLQPTHTSGFCHNNRDHACQRCSQYVKYHTIL
jgi:hypothetical protein